MDSNTVTICLDICLEGSIVDNEQLLMNRLKKQGISYFDPQTPAWSERYIPLEAQIKDNCHLLLFVITCDTRATSGMLEAGYYIGLGCEVVLCVQNVSDGAIIEGEQLSCQAVKDYNRGRMYLTDLANRQGIKVFDDVNDAVTCSMEMVKELKKEAVTRPL